MWRNGTTTASVAPLAAGWCGVLAEWLEESPPVEEAWLWPSPRGAAVALLAAGSLIAAWRLLFVPIDWTRQSLEEVGFGHLEDGKQQGGGRRGAWARVRASRRVGALPPPFPNGWFALVESEQLRPGQVAHVCALGETFAVWREESAFGARAHVFGAYCPHLGANMAAGGRVRGDCLECPFHGWRFRGQDGQCAAVPYAAKAVPEFARAKRWVSREVNGAVFVWHHADGEQPSWSPEPIEHVQSGQWACRGRSTFYVNCHIQEIPENGADVAHLNAVHSPLMTSGGDLRNSAGSRLASHAWRASWAPNHGEGLQHTATMRLRHELRLLGGKFLLMGNDIEAQQIGPGYVVLNIQTFFGRVIILQTVTPVEPMIQKVTHRMYGSKLVIQPFANFMFLGETIMFERDMMVWNHKMYLEKPILVSEDRAITRYRRWYSQFYSESSPDAAKSDLLQW